jgi:hypothetical protein
MKFVKFAGVLRMFLKADEVVSPLIKASQRVFVKKSSGPACDFFSLTPATHPFFWPPLAALDRKHEELFAALHVGDARVVV